jgi:eukaryotic-like serine/threonine-protein kinase
MKKLHTLITVIFFSIFNLNAQEIDYELWSFETVGRIYSNPLIDGNTIYFGCNDNTFYAIDANDGNELWRYQTSYNIQSGSTIVDSIIFFESGNSCYALNKDTGEEIWVHVNNNEQGKEKLDSWDYHHSTPVIDDSLIYFGLGTGSIIGLEIATGNLKVHTSTIDSVPIRSTPVINDGILYFGGWKGKAYAFDINANEIIWTRETYTSPPPYSTFGMLNTKMLIYDSLLIMGGRNPEISALNAYTGIPEWSFEVSDGGWISGDPTIVNDTLYIGGSDCHKLFAFDVHSGDLIWDYEFLYNNFSQPKICGNYVVFTTGSAYANNGTNYGHGYLYAVNKLDGSLKNFSRIGGNIFTTPIFYKGQIIVGSDDNHIYSLDSASFVSTYVDIKETGANSIQDTKFYPNPFKDSITISYDVVTPTDVIVVIYSWSGQEITKYFEGEKIAGKHEIVWYGNDQNDNEVEAGYYVVEILSKMVSCSNVIVKQ